MATAAVTCSEQGNHKLNFVPSQFAFCLNIWSSTWYCLFDLLKETHSTCPNRFFSPQTCCSSSIFHLSEYHHYSSHYISPEMGNSPLTPFSFSYVPHMESSTILAPEELWHMCDSLSLSPTTTLVQAALAAIFPLFPSTTQQPEWFFQRTDLIMWLPDLKLSSCFLFRTNMEFIDLAYWALLSLATSSLCSLILNHPSHVYSILVKLIFFSTPQALCTPFPLSRLLVRLGESYSSCSSNS